MAEEDVQQELERLRAENAALKEQQRSERALRLQVSVKGGVSLYGIRRFPVTFYVEEWRRILDYSSEILKFIADNENKLKKRDAS